MACNYGVDKGDLEAELRGLSRLIDRKKKENLPMETTSDLYKLLDDPVH